MNEIERQSAYWGKNKRTEPVKAFHSLRNAAGRYKTLVSVTIVFIFVYPLLHEFGHALAVWLFGGRVVSITVYPLFYTDCLIDRENVFCYIMTAISGILFPLFCSLLLKVHSAKDRMLVLYLRAASLGYSICELFIVIKSIAKGTTETSDLCVLMNATALDPYVSLVLAGFLFILTLLLLVASEPWNQVQKVFREMENMPASKPGRNYFDT